MSDLSEQEQEVRRLIVQQITLKLEREFGKPPNYWSLTMAVRRCANTEAKAIAGDRWRVCADEAIRVWRDV